MESVVVLFQNKIQKGIGQASLKIYFTEVFEDEKEQNSKHLYSPSKYIARRTKRNFRKTDQLSHKSNKTKD